MFDRWRERAYTANESASLAGLQRATLDMWVNRFPALVPGEKRGWRRWYSPHDVTILRLAVELERAGWSIPDALTLARRHLHAPPAADAILVVDATGSWLVTQWDVARLQVDKSKFLIPLGRMAGEIVAATAETYSAAA